jgi:hypothetical protein
MDPKERDIYARLSGTTKDFFRKGEQQAADRPTNFYKCIFEMITRLRQSCDDLGLIRNLNHYLGESFEGDVDDFVDKLIIEQDTDECPYCDTILTDPQEADCGHLYCKECIEHIQGVNLFFLSIFTKHRS